MIGLTPEIIRNTLTQIGQFVILILLTIIAVEVLLYLILHKLLHSRLALPYMLLAPAFLGILFLILYPFTYEVYLSFTNMSMRTAQNPSFGLKYGIRNFTAVFTSTVAHDASFWEVFLRTILWTVINVFFHVSGGMVLALLLNRDMRLRGLYRTLLVFPWAIPTVVAAMALRNEFDYRYGLFNIVLRQIGLSPIPWKQDPFWAFVSVVISNIWLGIPFMMVVILGGLQSISREYYEAAEIDGASSWQQFRYITMPLLRPVLTPAVIMGTVWTFNRLEVIWLITGGGPQEKTDILVSSMYKAAFQFYRYGFAAAFGLVIFAFLLIFAILYIKATGGLRGVYE